MKSIGTLYEECVFVGAGYGVSGKLRVSKYFSWWAGRRGGGVLDWKACLSLLKTPLDRLCCD